MDLLILGAGQYGMVAKEIAESTGHYGKIAFLDDHNPDAIGMLKDYSNFKYEYQNALVAIGKSDLRLQLLSELQECGYEIPILVHSTAYVSPSAHIEIGSIIEPMAVIHTDVRIRRGCLISAGAIINHNAVIEEGCHIDCGTIIGARKIVSKGTNTSYGAVLSE